MRRWWFELVVKWWWLKQLSRGGEVCAGDERWWKRLEKVARCCGDLS